MEDRFLRVTLLGLPFTACKMDDVREILEDAIESPSGLCRISTVNLDFLRLADEQPELRSAILSCEHRFADGWPILELADIAGHPLPERVTGSGLVPRILTWARDEGWHVALVGGMEETHEALQHDHSWDDVICGHWMPMYKDSRDLVDHDLDHRIEDSGADIVLVALGCPKQEFWIQQNLKESCAHVGIGIGASLEFLAHVKSRAPLWLQKMRLEFAWRLLQEPRRLGKRYLRDYIYWRRIRREWETAVRMGRDCL